MPLKFKITLRVVILYEALVLFVILFVRNFWRVCSQVWLSVRNSVWGPFNRNSRGNPSFSWLGGGGFMCAKIVNKHFVNKLAFPNSIRVLPAFKKKKHHNAKKKTREVKKQRFLRVVKTPLSSKTMVFRDSWVAPAAFAISVVFGILRTKRFFFLCVCRMQTRHFRRFRPNPLSSAGDKTTPFPNNPELLP